MHPWIALVTLAALGVYFAAGFNVGRNRLKHKVQAPSMSGPPEFERAVRIQMNTLEWLPLFLVPLWLFAFYWWDLAAASLGVVWVAARIVYAVSYMKDPATRGFGFAAQALVCLVLWLGALAGAVIALV